MGAAEVAIVVVQFFAGVSLFLGHGIHRFRLQRSMREARNNGYHPAVGVYQLFAEGIAPVLLALGAFPRVAAAFILIDMAGAMHYHYHAGDKYPGGWESAFLYFIAMVAVLIAGQGWLTLGLFF